LRGAWKDASLDWVENKQDGAVEVIATAPEGATLALEHTLIPTFVGEKFDSEVFMKAFGRIEKNPSLVIPERNLDLIIPAHAIPKGYMGHSEGVLSQSSAAKLPGVAQEVIAYFKHSVRLPTRSVRSLVVQSSDEQFDARFLSVYSRSGNGFDARMARSVLDQSWREVDEPATRE
jgi:hypothetical protein